MSYDKTISADLYDQKWEDGTITITMKRGASVPVIIIKVTGAELTGSYTLSVKADAGAAEWSAAKTGELSATVWWHTSPSPARSPSLWTWYPGPGMRAQCATPPKRASWPAPATDDFPRR